MERYIIRNVITCKIGLDVIMSSLLKQSAIKVKNEEDIPCNKIPSYYTV